MTAELDRIYAEASVAHQQGNLPAAERLYRQILAENPGHFDALQMLGILAVQTARFDVGEPLFRRALRVNPESAFGAFNLGVALQAMARSEEALEWYERAAALNPNYREALYNRGVVLLELRRYEDAVAAYDAALAVSPQSVESLANRGVALQALGRRQEALETFDRALLIEPGSVRALANRGNVLMELDRPEQALSAFEQALLLQPGNPELELDRGRVLARLGREEEALACYDRIVARHPRYAAAHYNRGLTLRRLNRVPESLAAFQKALAVQPNYAEALHGLGSLLEATGRWEEALECYSRALALDPSFLRALNDRASLLADHWRISESARDFAELLRRDPNADYAVGALFFALANACDWRDRAAMWERIVSGVRSGRRVITPFPFVVSSDSSADQIACFRDYVAVNYPVAPAPLWRGERYGHDKIRVAYLSGDFHRHATALLTAGLFEHHDKSCFEITAISSGPATSDPLRARVQVAFDHFIDVRGRSDEDVARLLREREIDIAVDLKGYTSGCRAGVFAQRPAPVQVNYLAWPGTLGSPYMDYILADETVIPSSEHAYYSEEVVYLPGSYQVNDTTREIARHTPTRAEAGLPEEGFVFCCFNNTYKITPELFGIWMRLLLQVEDSVLWLLEANDSARANLGREAEARGVAPERLVFAPRLSLPEHLARHRAADLFVDTLPFNAHTTGSDALWAGLPLVTCLGTTFAGRVAASLLKAVGLPELICESLAAYESKALVLARTPALLAETKHKLAASLATAPLFDVARTTRHIEAAFRAMHEHVEKGESPATFAVEPEV